MRRSIAATRTAILAAGAFLALLASMPAVTQEAAEVRVADVEAGSESAAVPTFGELINVKVINVDVYVTDKKGNAISALTVDDFELYEDKKPISISNFYEFREGTPVGRDAPQPAAPKKSKKRTRDNVFSSHPALQKSEIPDDQRLYMVVYIDQFNLTPPNRNRTLRFLRQFLRTKLTREDRIMLMTYNRSVKIELPFTSDPQIIADALFELEKHTGGRTLWNSERRDILSEIERSESYGQSLARVRLHAESIFNDMQFTLDGLKEAVGKLAGVPGRKALLYISEGLPMRSAEDLFWALDEKFQDQATASGSTILQTFHYDASRRFNDLANIANAGRVAFYTIDAGGLRVGGMRSAEFRGMNFSSNIDSIYQRNMIDSIMFMADRTGGQAVVNTNNILGGLDRMASDFRNYYSLGFQSSHPGTGRLYNLEVKLRKDLRKQGYKLRFRETYRDKPLVQEMGDATLASLSFGYQSNPLGVSLHPNRANTIQREDGTWLVALDVRMPIDKLVFFPAKDEQLARVRIFVQAADEKGRISQVQEENATFEISTDKLDEAIENSGFFTYELKLVMRPGDQRVSVAVRDDLNSRSSVVNKFVSVG